LALFSTIAHERGNVILGLDFFMMPVSQIGQEFAKPTPRNFTGTPVQAVPVQPVLRVQGCELMTRFKPGYPSVLDQQARTRAIMICCTLQAENGWRPF
jgi:hypothetical protein